MKSTCSSLNLNKTTSVLKESNIKFRSAGPEGTPQSPTAPKIKVLKRFANYYCQELYGHI